MMKSLDVSMYILIFFFGYVCCLAKLEYDDLQKDKKEHCIKRYKVDPTGTLAGDFCDSFFLSLREGE